MIRSVGPSGSRIETLAKASRGHPAARPEASDRRDPVKQSRTVGTPAAAARRPALPCDARLAPSLALDAAARQSPAASENCGHRFPVSTGSNQPQLGARAGFRWVVKNQTGQQWARPRDLESKRRLEPAGVIPWLERRICGSCFEIRSPGFAEMTFAEASGTEPSMNRN